MHSSFFNYNLTRPYPYRWFTPLALIGAVILIVLLSVMNFVQNSYSLIVQYAEDPNSTVSNGIWYSHWPSYLTSSVKPVCEPANLPVNTQFFTNQTGFTWTLTSIFKENDNTTASPSLPYMNNILEDCVINNIKMQFGDSPLVQSAQELGAIITSADVQVRAFVTCGVWGPMGYAKFNATALYDTVSPTSVAGTASFVGSDRLNKASMYWVEALLSAYWLQLEEMIAGGVISSWSPYRQIGLAILFPNSPEGNIMDLDFFNITYSFMVAEGSHPSVLTLESDLLAPISHYIQRGQTRDLKIRPMDSLAKSMYSAVLTDLGQTKASRHSNIVADVEKLRYFSKNCSAAADLSGISNLPEIETQDYDTVQSSHNPTGLLRLTPSVISTKYLCQVPQRKPLGDILIAVLLADLVLLQAAWKLYTFGVDQIMTRMQRTAKACEGCLEMETEQEIAAKAIVMAQKRMRGPKLMPSISVLSREASETMIGQARRS